jgi:hypothetical protein
LACTDLLNEQRRLHRTNALNRIGQWICRIRIGNEIDARKSLTNIGALGGDDVNAGPFTTVMNESLGSRSSATTGLNRCIQMLARIRLRCRLSGGAFARIGAG